MNNVFLDTEERTKCLLGVNGRNGNLSNAGCLGKGNSNVRQENAPSDQTLGVLVHNHTARLQAIEKKAF